MLLVILILWFGQIYCLIPLFFHYSSFMYLLYTHKTCKYCCDIFQQNKTFKNKAKKIIKYVSSSTSKNYNAPCCFLSLILSIETQCCRVFLSIDRKIYTHTNNQIDRGHILFDISFANKSETDSNKHYWCVQDVQVKNSFCSMFFCT